MERGKELSMAHEISGHYAFDVPHPKRAIAVASIDVIKFPLTCAGTRVLSYSCVQHLQQST